MHAISI